MVKDKLRKEAVMTVEWECTSMIDRPTFINGYITGAEPREEQISKLEDTLEKVETERIQLIAKLAFTENALNNCKAKIEKVIYLITELSQLKHHTDDCFSYDAYLELIKDAKQFLNNKVNKMKEKI